MSNDRYDPTNDSGDFYGVTFVTENGSRYIITKNGIFIGRSSIEGGEVLCISGIDISLYRQSLATLDNRDDFLSWIADNGQRPRRGLCLMVGLTEESSKEKSRNGIVTSVIVNIE